MARGRILTEDERKDVAVWYVCGASIAYICQRWGISRALVNKIVKSYDIDPDRGKRGEVAVCGKCEQRHPVRVSCAGVRRR